MVNVLSLATRIHHALPADQAPETTDGYQGFYHLSNLKGQVERAEMHYILRDVEREEFEARKRKMREVAHQVGEGLPRDCYIEPLLKPIRGLPCPNPFTGSYYCHSKHEFITLKGMEQALAVIMRVAALTVARAR